MHEMKTVIIRPYLRSSGLYTWLLSSVKPLRSNKKQKTRIIQYERTSSWHVLLVERKTDQHKPDMIAFLS